MVNERTPGFERTPAMGRTRPRRGMRIFSVLIAVAGILTLAIGPALARNDVHNGALSNHGGLTNRDAIRAFVLSHQALLEEDENEVDGPDVSETEPDEGENEDSQGDTADENAQGDDSQGDTADANDQGDTADANDQGDDTNADESDTEGADENDGDAADESDSNEPDGDSEDSGGDD